MPRGKLKKKNEKEVVLPTVDDMKIRKSLILMTDKFNERARDIIKASYQDRKLLLMYEKIRQSEKYQKAQGAAHHRKIIEFPNPEVFDFVNAVMNAKYGREWLYDNRALRHELVKPWLVIKKL